MKVAKIGLLMAILALNTALAITTDPEVGEEVILRLKTGPSFLSNATPISTAFGLGADIQLGLGNNFGMGATFSHGWASAYTTTTPSVQVSQKVTIMGLNPYFA